MLTNYLQHYDLVYILAFSAFISMCIWLFNTASSFKFYYYNIANMKIIYLITMGLRILSF